MNSKFQLFLDTKNLDLFRKATSELGTTFYHLDREDGAFTVVYFSGSRIARFEGVPDEKMIQFCENLAYEVESIMLDEVAGTVRIIESKGTKETKP